MLKQIQIQETATYSSSDFEFYLNICKHPKLQPEMALHLIDTMAKIYLNDLIYANCAAKPFIIIAKRFLSYEPVYNFVVKYMTMTFSMLPGLESKKKKEEASEGKGGRAQSKRKGKKPVLVGKAAEEFR